MSNLRPSNTLFCYDESFEGFLTVVFTAYACHAVPASIQPASCAQPMLGQQVVEVATDLTLAERVKVGICNHAGFKTFCCLEKAFRSCVEGRELDLFAYIELAMSRGRKGVQDLSNEVVARTERLRLKTENEMEYMRQFVRFQLMENGVYAAVVNPRADVVPLVMGFFVERYNTQPFIIYDEVHRLAALWDLKRTSFVKTDEFSMPLRSEEESAYERLWKTFYDSISNEQRFNPDLRRAHMPKRFWKNLTEMQMSTK